MDENAVVLAIAKWLAEQEWDIVRHGAASQQEGGPEFRGKVVAWMYNRFGLRPSVGGPDFISRKGQEIWHPTFGEIRAPTYRRMPFRAPYASMALIGTELGRQLIV
jgi:hypothetical protein